MHRPHASKITRMRIQTLKMNALRACIKRIEAVQDWHKKRVHEKTATPAEIERRRREEG